MSARQDRWGDGAAIERERVRRGDGSGRSASVDRSHTSTLVNPVALKRDAHDPDYIIMVAVLALSAIGILMVYSASAIDSYRNSQNTFQLVAPQVMAGLLGIAAMIFLMRLDYRYLRVVSVPLAFVALGMLAIVLQPGIGISHAGSSRWLYLGPLPDIHPAEVAKLALAVYLAHWLATRGGEIKSFWRGTVPYWAIVAPFLLLVIREPDLGTAGVIVLLAFSLYFVAGANLFHIMVAGVGACCAAAVVVLAMRGYPLERIQTLLDPWAHPLTTGYHTIQGLEAITAGGWFGTGLGNDKVFVPASVNDFIFSVICQELGLAGGAVVIFLFVAFAYAGIRTALRAPDTFGGLMAAGITAWICFQALINIGVVVAVVPVTGITLPFVSAGGSSLTVTLAAVGILLSVSRETVERGWVSATADSGRGYGGTYIPGSRRS